MLITMRHGHYPLHFLRVCTLSCEVTEHKIAKNSVTLRNCHYKKLSYRWQTARYVQRSVKVTEHGTIPYVRYGFLLLCYSNFVRKTHRFLGIRLQKCRDLENRVRDPSRSLKMSPIYRTHTTSYWRSIVTMALSRVISEIFNVEKYRALEIPVKGQSRFPFGRLCMVSC